MKETLTAPELYKTPRHAAIVTSRNHRKRHGESMIVAEDVVSASRAFSAAHGLFSLSEAIHTGEGVVLEGIGNTGDPRTRSLYGHHKEAIRSKGDNDCEFGL